MCLDVSYVTVRELRPRKLFDYNISTDQFMGW